MRRSLEGYWNIWISGSLKEDPNPGTMLHAYKSTLDYSRRGAGPSGPEADSQIPSFENDVHKDSDYPIETYAPFETYEP